MKLSNSHLCAAAEMRSARLRAALVSPCVRITTDPETPAENVRLRLAGRTGGSTPPTGAIIKSARGLLATIALGCGGCVPGDLLDNIWLAAAGFMIGWALARWSEV